MSEALWDDQRIVIDTAIAEIKQDLATTHPGLRWSSGYLGPQPVFPFRAFASIALDGRDDDIDSIDFSIDCKLDDDRLRVSSDICYSDGQFIAEGPVGHEPDDQDRADWVSRQIEGALEFFRANLEPVRHALPPAE